MHQTCTEATKPEDLDLDDDDYADEERQASTQSKLNEAQSATKEIHQIHSKQTERLKIER